MELTNHHLYELNGNLYVCKRCEAGCEEGIGWLLLPIGHPGINECGYYEDREGEDQASPVAYFYPDRGAEGRKLRPLVEFGFEAGDARLQGETVGVAWELGFVPPETLPADVNAAAACVPEQSLDDLKHVDTYSLCWKVISYME